MKIKNNKSTIDFEKIYQENLTLFKEIDYLYNRYEIDYTIVLFEFMDCLIDKDIDLEEFLRISDKYIRIDKKYHLVIFSFSSFKQSFQTILSIEKKIIRAYSLFYKDVLFNSYSQSMTKDLTTLSLLKKINFSALQKVTDDIF